MKEKNNADLTAGSLGICFCGDEKSGCDFRVKILYWVRQVNK